MNREPLLDLKLFDNFLILALRNSRAVDTNLGRQPDDCQNSYLRSICKDWMVKPSRMKCSTFVRGERIATIFRLSTFLLASIRLRINSSMNVRFRRIRLTRNN